MLHGEAGGVQDRRPSILIVDDHLPTLEALARLLKGQDWTVRTVLTTADAIAQVKSQRPTLAFVDLLLGTESGFDLTQAMLAVDSAIAVVLFTSLEWNSDLAASAVECGAMTLLKKPVHRELILRLLNVARRRGLPVKALESVKREYVGRVLDLCDGNQAEAARVLEIDRRSVPRILGWCTKR